MAVVDNLASGLSAPARGATLVQVRAPQATAREVLDITRRLVAELEVPIVVSSRVDIAAAAGAAGVNLPVSDIAVADARALLGPDALVGRSTHSVEEAQRAAAEGAGYVLLGPVFDTPSHPDLTPLGVDVLADAAAAVTIPVLAIGGVDSDRARQCLAAGAGGYAAIRMFA